MSLEEYNETYKDCRSKRQNTEVVFDKVPYGLYKVIVDKLVIKTTKSTNMEMLSWQLRIIGGKQNNRCIFKNTVIMDSTIKIIEKDLSIFMLDIEKMSDLEENLHNYAGSVLEIEFKQNANRPEFDNIYFKKLIDGNEQTNEPTNVAPKRFTDENFDDIPF